jgi:hypothetical protein
MSHNHATDTALLDAIRIDDTTAFEELISRYGFAYTSTHMAKQIPGNSC